jgi:hypothetical protein
MSDSNRSRRAFLGGFGQAAAALVGGGLIARVAAASPGSSEPAVARDAVPPPIGTSTCGVHDDLPAAADPAALGFLGAIGAGTALSDLAASGAGEWSIARVHAVFRGALPFVLAHPDGRRAQVDLMAIDGESPPGIAATRAGQLYLVNSGRGTMTTPRDLERAIQRLGELLASRDGAGLGLLSFAERHRCHPGGVFVVPV